jgi:hypothetical protein
LLTKDFKFARSKGRWKHARLVGVAVATLDALTGKRKSVTLPLPIRVGEDYAVLALVAVILVVGFISRSGVASRHEAAKSILDARSQPPGLAGRIQEKR